MGEDGASGATGGWRVVVLLLLVTSAAIPGCESERGFPRRSDAASKPNVLLVTLDTTRADRLGVYGHEPSPSPNLDRLAADAVVHTRAVSTSSWTLPSHASLFTGRYPLSHGARYDTEGPLFLSLAIDGPELLGGYRVRGLAEEEVTLAERLRDDGYATAGIVAGPWMKRLFGLAAGFDLYDDSLVSGVEGGRASDVTDRALAFLRDRGGERFFLFLNYYDPHWPYAPPLSFRIGLGPRYWFVSNEAEAANALYDAEIRYLDRHLGRLVDGLHQLHLYDDTLIVMTADHGELLGEGGRSGHGKTLTEAELHVPMIVKHPGNAGAGERRGERVSIAGVYDLVLSRVGLEAGGRVEARMPPEPGAPVLAETHPLPMLSKQGAWRALYEGRYKLLWNARKGWRLYDLDADPAEGDELSEARPDLGRRLRAALDEIVSRAPSRRASGAPQAIDAETRRALEGLGYLE